MGGNAKGEVAFEVGGKQYIWHFSVGAICALEDHLDRGLFSITEELQSWLPPTRQVDGKAVPVDESPEQASARQARIRLGFARSVFWAGLQDHQPEHSIKMAGDLMGEMGGLIPALAVIVKGMSAAMPDAPAEEQPARPRRASRSK